MTAPLTLYNSITRGLEPFAPLDPATGARLYSCGPTVYNYAHLGNLRAYVFTDTLARVLTWKGYSLTHVINITDVGHLTSDADAGDDKMEAAARAQKQSIWDIAAHYTQAFKDNVVALNIREPTRWSVATDHIDDMLAFAKRIAPDHCYEIDSGLYFDATTVPEYGKLAGARDDAGANDAESRIDPVAGKRHAQDFAIWRKSAPGETRQMEWDSPWGKGAPGWHLECSVMSEKYLGFPFDIHTGGIDHREIHHPNEIAQNQAFCACADAPPGFTGAHFWMHNNFLVDRTGKMSKSKGGVSTLFDLVEAGIHPLAYRLFCLQAQYRSELDFGPEPILAALTRLKRLVMSVQSLRDRAELGEELPAPDETGIAALDAVVSDDLNTPKALTALESMLADKTLSPETRLGTLQAFDTVLGLTLLELRREDLRLQPANAPLTEAEVRTRIAERETARKDRDFATADRLRDDLTTAGVEVMDGDPLGWDWQVTLD